VRLREGQVVGIRWYDYTAERGIAAIATDPWYGGGVVVGCSVEVGACDVMAQETNDSASSPA
jgi:hypothetical protein